MMLQGVIVFGLVALACSAPFTPELDSHWELYKEVHKKFYKAEEESARRLIWETNLARMVQYNIESDLGKHSFKLGVNRLSDMTTEEVNSLLNGYRRHSKVSYTASNFVLPWNIPSEVNWVKEGLVTGVKDQGQCGSCWAFSTTGSLEGQHKRKTGKLVSLSEQNLIDCSKAQGNKGCEGGLMDNAFEYIKENRGIDTEDSYPYEGQDDKDCRFKRSTVGATLSGYVDIPSGDEVTLMKAVATVGPVSVAIDASKFEFQHYSHGVYYDETCSSTELDHGVLVVGYGVDNGQDYWLVKNSWGANWGLHGYIKMSRNKNNQCGIATQASYPLV